MVSITHVSIAVALVVVLPNIHSRYSDCSPCCANLCASLAVIVGVFNLSEVRRGMSLIQSFGNLLGGLLGADELR